MGLRERLASGSGRRPLVITIAVVVVAALIAGSTVAIVRNVTGSKHETPTPASLGVTRGGPDRGSAAGAVATFGALMHLPVRQPADCTDLSKQYHVLGPHIWLVRTQVAAFLRSSDDSAVQMVEAALNRSPDVAYWVYEPPAAVLAEAQRTATCSAVLPKTAIPPTFRVALTRRDLATVDALTAQLRDIAAVAATSCSNCSRSYVQTTPSPGSVSP